MNNQTVITAALIIAGAIVFAALCNRFTFHDVTLSDGAHLQLRGDKLTGELHQVFIR